MRCKNTKPIQEKIVATLPRGKVKFRKPTSGVVRFPKPVKGKGKIKHFC